MSLESKKQVVSKVIEFYKNGGLPGYDTNNETCAYYISDNRRCAIGCLLPAGVAKELQQHNGENNLVPSVYYLYSHLHCFPESVQSVLKPLFEQVGQPFLSDLQIIHDRVASEFAGEAFVQRLESRLNELVGEN